jgi:hypothetical protein
MQRQTQGVKYKCIESNENGNVVTPRTKTRRAAQVPLQDLILPGCPYSRQPTSLPSWPSSARFCALTWGLGRPSGVLGPLRPRHRAHVLFHVLTPSPSMARRSYGAERQEGRDSKVCQLLVYASLGGHGRSSHQQFRLEHCPRWCWLHCSSSIDNYKPET